MRQSSYLSRSNLLIIAAFLGLAIAVMMLAVAAMNRVDPGRYITQARYNLPFVKPKPSVVWKTASPESVGIDSAALARLSKALADRNTRSFLVVKDGQLVHEWYSSEELVNDEVSVAALAKSLVGSTLLAALMTDGYIDADDRVSRYVSEWNGDAERSSMTVRHILTHTSGIENVDFREGLTGWQKTYFEEKDKRFSMVLRDIPLRFSPGSQYEYSGTAFYALAYAAASSLKNAPTSDIEEYFRVRILEPLGIPESARKLSYGESYQQDGMKLYAIGSGASFTPRAIAKIGQLVLQHGAWEGRQLIDARLAEQMISYDGATPPPDVLAGRPAPALGWWTNNLGTWPNVPRDAAVGIGLGHQVLVVIPSLDLVAVRTGGTLGEVTEYAPGYNTWNDLEKHLLNPLMETVAPNSTLTQITQ